MCRWRDGCCALRLLTARAGGRWRLCVEDARERSRATEELKAEVLAQAEAASLSHLGQVSGRPRLAIRTLSRRSSSRRRRRRESWPSTSRSDSRTSDDPVIDREYHSAGCQQELREETARQREAHAEAGRKLASVEAAEEEVRKAGAKAVQSLMAEFQVLRAEAEEARKTTEQQVLACGEGRSRAFFHGVAA